MGSHIVIPGIDANMLTSFKQNSQQGLLGLLDMFSGGAFSHASIFALGIMPYISASIVIQLMGMAVPYFQRLQKEGESGRKKINQITRWLTILVTGLQAPAYISNIVSQMPSQAFYPFIPDASISIMFYVTAVIVLVTGTMFVMWLGEKITDKGIGEWYFFNHYDWDYCPFAVCFIR